MVLLQISEPNTPPILPKQRLAAGIDLGTTHSLIATSGKQGVEVLLDEQGESLLPSVVYYGKESIQVGTAAEIQTRIDPANGISSVKRMIGRSLENILANNKRLPYQFSQTEHGLPKVVTQQGEMNPIQISAEILKTLASRAEKYLSGSLEGVVITVPAYFDDSQRQSTKEAAKLAGLPVLRLLSEPTAAALAYGLDSGQEGIIAVYDLGGGTFDISILRLSKGIFEVLATGGDSALGGDDFNLLLAEWIREKAHLNHTIEPVLERQLIELATQCKVALSEKEQVEAAFLDWQGVITRTDFERLIEELIKKTINVCRRAIKDAGIRVDEVIETILVGGSTRIPLVRKHIGAFFSKMPLSSIDPEQVVATGAALQADILIGNKPEVEMLLLDVIPLSLGLEIMGGLVEKIIPRNTPIPIVKAQEFTTFKDGQTAMLLHVLQGERELVEDCRSLAQFTLNQIPALPAGGANIRVIFQVDADGLLSVTAVEKSTSVQASVQVKPSYGLSEIEIANMLKSSFQYAEIDAKRRALLEKRVEGERLLQSTLRALQIDSHLLTKAEENLIEESIKLLQVTLQQEESLVIEEAIKSLDRATQDFAARRMDYSIRRALTGHSVDDI